MEFATLNDFIKDNKIFLDIKLSEHREFFKGDLFINNTQYIVSEDVIDLVRKLSGVSSSMSKILRTTSESSWIDTIILMYKYYYPEERIYLLVDNNNLVLDATAKSVKPLLNSEFFQETYRFFSDYEDLINIFEFNYSASSTTSEILIFQKNSYKLESGEYKVGILLTNDELSKVTCTLAIDYEGIIFYLPKKYYNLSSTRYNKTSQDSIEAYKLLLLRILEDMSREGQWDSILGEIHNHIMSCKSLPITYEEYRRATRLLARATAVSEMDNEEYDAMTSYLEDEISDFEKNYPAMQDKKGSYIWRCSAVSDSSVYYLICALQTIYDSYAFYPEVSSDIRRTLGEFLVLGKLSTELARKVGGGSGL